MSSDTPKMVCFPAVDRVPYIEMLAENNVRKGFFEHGEFLALRDALSHYLKGFATFSYKTGWRVAEIAGLTWSQVNLERALSDLRPEKPRMMQHGQFT